MKKTSILLMMSVASVFSLVGCVSETPQSTEKSVVQNVKKSPEETKDSLLTYLNEDLKQLSEKEAKIISLYESVTGQNYTDDETTYNMISNEIVPQYRDFIDEVESVNVKNPEISKVHEVYIKAINLQNSAFLTILSAIEEQDLEKMNQANNQLAEARAMIRDYHQQLEVIATENNVELFKR